MEELIYKWKRLINEENKRENKGIASEKPFSVSHFEFKPKEKPGNAGYKPRSKGDSAGSFSIPNRSPSNSNAKHSNSTNRNRFKNPLTDSKCSNKSNRSNKSVRSAYSTRSGNNKTQDKSQANLRSNSTNTFTFKSQEKPDLSISQLAKPLKQGNDLIKHLNSIIKYIQSKSQSTVDLDYLVEQVSKAIKMQSLGCRLQTEEVKRTREEYELLRAKFEATDGIIKDYQMKFLRAEKEKEKQVKQNHLLNERYSEASQLNDLLKERYVIY